MADTDIPARLMHLKDKIAQADRERAAAEARVAEAQKRLKEIDDQIAALGVKPDEAEKTVVALEAKLTKDIAEIEVALAKELDAYKALGAA